MQAVPHATEPAEFPSDHAWTPYRPRLLQVLRRGVRNSILPVVEEAKRVGGDHVELRLPGLRIYLVSDPESIEYVLVRARQTYIRGEPSWSYARRGLGDGLICSDGELHQRQRRRIQPAFQPRRIERYAETVTEITQRTAQEWGARAGSEVDLNADMMRLTMLIIARVLAGIDLSGRVERLADAVTTINLAAMSLDASLLGLLAWIPTKMSRAVKRAVRDMDDFVYPLLRERRRSGIDQGDLLSALLEVDPDDKQVRDEMVTLFGAGHETTANLLSWTWYLLAQNPQVEERLHAELARVLGGRAPGFADLDKLPYTEKVILESMRIYPPVWETGRLAVEADRIDGRPVPARALVGTLPYLVHRDPRWYPDPMRFDPERFTPEASRARPRFAYFPFGGGDRRCVGEAFAMMEGKLILATLAQSFRPRLIPGHVVELEPMVSLRPKGGLPMVLDKR